MVSNTLLSRKKIAIIGLKGLPAIGGAARATEMLITLLNDRYSFIVYAVDSHMVSEYTVANLKFIVLKGSKNRKLNTFIYYVKACFHALICSSYDIIHLQHLYSGFLAPLLKIKYRIVTTVRGIVPIDDNKWSRSDKLIFKLFEKLAIQFSDTIVTVAKPHIPYLQQYTKKEIIYIPNGTRVESSRLSKRKEYILFAAARIISLKGCHLFLEALQKLHYSNPVIIIGDLDQVPSYKQLLVNLSQELDVTFTGLIKDKDVLLAYLREAKLFVFPSFNEGMSNMLLEAASCKAPIICSGIIENRAVFDNDEVLFYQSGDVTDLTLKIEWALNNYDTMIEMSEKAMKRIQKDYRWEDIAEKYSLIYDELMDKSK